MQNKLFDFVDLHQGEEQREKVLENIKANTSFRGSNLWILACAIVVASVGLNVNSTAVIIGAMLISPLMGPIVGAGFALAIYDFELLKKSVKNLSIATVVSLTVATIYFFVSPFKDAQSELLARTSPNIYDVLIAFFGGLVGVIALTRVEKGNPIPGVAIATALMPPLCTAGYGLAIENYNFFLGAFYLYLINCFFICIATFVIVKYLKYQPVKILNQSAEKRIRYGITALVLIMIIPSFYLAYTLFEEKKFNQKVAQFIAQEFTDKGYVVIYKNIKYNTNPKKIELAFFSKRFNTKEIDLVNQKLKNYEIANTQIEIRQNATDLKSEILTEIGKNNKAGLANDALIQNLERELNRQNEDYKKVVQEIGILFPELQNVSIGKQFLYPSADSTRVATVLLYHLPAGKNAFSNVKIKEWLESRLGSKEVLVVETKQPATTEEK